MKEMFDYNKTLQIIATMSATRYLNMVGKLAGLHRLVASPSNKQKVVGLLGSLFPHDLNDVQKKYLCDFYSLPGSAVEIKNEYTDKKGFNGFVIITQPENLWRIAFADRVEYIAAKTFADACAYADAHRSKAEFPIPHQVDAATEKE